MTLRRPRTVLRLRASLVAMVVAVACVLAIVGASVRAPDGLLGVAFARACAAESATTGSHPRLRGEREEARLDAAPALAPSPSAKTTPAPPREADPTLRFVASTTAARCVLAPRVDGFSSLGWRSADPPTRGRARLMVFLI